MSDLSIVHHTPRTAMSTLALRKPADPLPLVLNGASGRRCKIWDIAPPLHCSIIGTCLSAAELRQFFVKMGDSSARTASDHTLHSSGVLAAGKRDLIGKLLNKTLDHRHEAAIRRFAKAASRAQVREFWLEAFEQGAIPGGYWALLTHPATDRPLVEEAFGQVHMLSHMVGSSNRMDIARLRTLERALGERDEKIARQQARLSEGAGERSALLRKVEDLESEIRRRGSVARPASDAATDALAHAVVLQRLDAEKAHSCQLASRIAELEREHEKAHKITANLHKQVHQLQREVAALEAELNCRDADEQESDDGDQLNGLISLYVGGRPGLIDQLRLIVAKRGGTLLSHDGGVEESLAALPGLIGRAGAVFFPVDCVSHSAVRLVKKGCRDGGKPFIPLRAASVASFVAALSGLDGGGRITVSPRSEA